MNFNTDDSEKDVAKASMKAGRKSPEIAERVTGFKHAYDKNHETFLQIAAECEDFTFGEQWSEADREEMRSNKRPALTINMILRAVAAVYGEYSSMRGVITTKSRGRKSFDASSLLNKVIDQVLYDCNYSDEESEVFFDGCITGRGYFEVRLSDDNDPTGVISITSQDNMQIVLHPQAKTYDPDKWPAVYTVDYLTYDEVEELYGEEAAESVMYSPRGTSGLNEEDLMENGHTFGGDSMADSSGSEEATNVCRVISEQAWERREAYVLVDPNTTDYETVWADEMSLEEATSLAEDNQLIMESRKVRHPKFYVYTDGDVLLFEGWSPYRHINIIPYFFYFRKGRSMGMVENLRSPQEQINKGESQELHIVNSTSNGGWQMEENSLVNMSSEELERSGAKPGLVIVRRRGSQPLDKIFPNTVPSGISNLGNKATSHLIGVSGVNEGMLGSTPQNVSGRVVDHKKQSGQSQLQMPFDNLERTRKLLGRIVLSIIQDYFTEARVLRYTASDSPEDEDLILNQVNAAGQIVNDVSLGRYDIVVTTRPKQDVYTDYEFAELMALQEAGVAVPPWYIVEKSHVSSRYSIAEDMKTAAGLNPTKEQVEMQSVQMQIALETSKQELLELRAKTAKLEAEVGLIVAETDDIKVGQNNRFILGLQNSQVMDERGAALRTTLAARSADTQIAKQVLSANAKKSEKILEAELRNGTENKAPALGSQPQPAAENTTTNTPTNDGAKL